MGARDTYANDDFPTQEIYVNEGGEDSRLAAYAEGNRYPMPPAGSRVRRGDETIDAGRDEYQGLGYDGADELRIGSAFDLTAKNAGIIGPGTGSPGVAGWPLTGGSLNGKAGGFPLPHLSLMQERAGVVPYGTSADELVEVPALYVGQPS